MWIHFSIEFPDIVEKEIGHVTCGGVAGDSLPLTTLTRGHRPMKGEDDL